MTERFRASFKKRVARGDKHPLIWAIYESFFFEIWLGAGAALGSHVFMVVVPFTLRFLIQFATDAYAAEQSGTPAPHIGRGIGLVLGITAMQVVQSLCTNHFIYRGMMVGGEVRAVLIGLVFEKSMVLSGRAKAGGVKEGGENADTAETEKKGNKDEEQRPGIAGDGTGWGNGRITNLMSVDTYRMDQASALFHMMWAGPVGILITLVVLIINLTYSALAGFALLVVGFPLLTRAIRSLLIRRKKINKVTDQRVSLTQEILQSVRFVKFFGWEISFLERLREIRRREVYGIQIILATRNAINAVSMSLPVFASMLAFITYSLTNHDLRAAEIFSSLALFNSMRLPLNMLPLVLGQVVDAWSSAKRIQEFLLAEEMEEDVVHDPNGDYALNLRDTTFTWERTPTQDPDSAVSGGAAQKGGALKRDDPRAENGLTPSGEETEGSFTTVVEREPFKIRDLDFSIRRDELVAVIGTVGSGKSSLLAALAGDMRKTDGEVVLGASRAFCPQYAWIQNATVRDNILFGKEMDKEWYQEVIRA